MIIRSLELKDYRNFESLKAEFSPGVNLIHGENAQGKTNVLEAVYECATARSHRGSKDREIIRFGCEEAHVRLFLEKNESLHRIDLHIKNGRPKGAAVGGVPLSRVNELFGYLNAVFFSPEDLKIIKNSPGERRRFIDIELCQLSPLYSYNLLQFNKALLQRNSLLKEAFGKRELLSLLDVWDEQLVRFGKLVMASREEFVQELAEVLRDIHLSLSGGKEQLRLQYQPDTPPAALEERLFTGRDNDLRFGSTSVGPQRDDLAFFLNDIDIRRFGSQGQQRTAALSLKMAEIELVKKKIHDTPVLLLDDVLSELDRSRQRQLVESLQGVQTILTCTGLDDFVREHAQVGKTFKAAGGTLVEEGIETYE